MKSRLWFWPCIWLRLLTAVWVIAVVDAAVESSLPPCAEILVASPPALRPLAAVGHATTLAQQPCAMVEEGGPLEEAAEDPKACCDDASTEFRGLAVLGFVFASCAGLSIFGLWRSLKGTARRAPEASVPPRTSGAGQAAPTSFQEATPNQASKVSMGSGTPNRGLSEGVEPGLSKVSEGHRHLTGSSSSRSLPSWSSAISLPDGMPISRQISETPKAATNVTLWVYAPPEPRPLALRNAPTLSQSAKTKVEFKPGNAFWVSDTVEGENGMTFLKVADSVGWVFDRHPDHGVLCKLVDLISVAFSPEQEKAGFKITFPNGGGPLVTSVSSDSAKDAGLRAGDRIVRIDGQWVREKQSARAALQCAVSISRTKSRPMTLEVYRPEGEEDEEEEADGNPDTSTDTPPASRTRSFSTEVPTTSNDTAVNTAAGFEAFGKRAGFSAAG